MYEAIRRLQVRGAPAIGICAGYCMYALAREIPGEGEAFYEELKKAGAYLNSSRPKMCIRDRFRAVSPGGLWPPGGVFSFDGSTAVFFLPLAKRKWGWNLCGGCPAPPVGQPVFGVEDAKKAAERRPFGFNSPPLAG